MKKWLCMALAAMMTLACVGGYAELKINWVDFNAEIPKGEEHQLISYNIQKGDLCTVKYDWLVDAKEGKWESVIETQDGSDGTTKPYTLGYSWTADDWSSRDEGEYGDYWAHQSIITWEEDSNTYTNTYTTFKDLPVNNGGTTIRLQILDQNDKLIYEGFFNAEHILSEDGKIDYVKLWEKLAELMAYDEDDTITYSHNSVCSFGPHYRDLEEAKTDKWYTFSVIDVSQDGKQTLPLIGGNVYIIGFVTIERKGDELTLKTRYLPDVWVYNEFYTLFPDYESITSDDLDNLTDGYAFGQTLSIADDLDGDTSLILQVRNEATFKSDNKAIRRFYENLDEFKAWRQAMLSALGKTETTTPKRYNVAPKQ